MTVVDGGLNDADGLANGIFQINNVMLGTYTITETIAPAGYMLDTDATRVVNVTSGALTQIIGVQGTDDPGITDESDFHNARINLIVVAQGKSPRTPQQVTLLDAETGAILSQFAPYGNAFQGGVRIATGDFTGDHSDEIITAPGWSIAAEVRVYTQNGVLLTSFYPYGSAFVGGVQLATGDVDGDGLLDIITVPSTGPAEVKVFRGMLVGGVPIFDALHPYKDFLAFPSTFIGGAVIAVADMGFTSSTTKLFANTLDNKAEIIVGSGAGMTATVKVFDVSEISILSPNSVAAASKTFTPFSTTSNSYKGGLSLAVAKVNADVVPDIVVGAGVLGGSQVDVWAWNNLNATLKSLSSNGLGFAAYTDASRTAPVQVSSLDINEDGISDTIVVSQGPGGTTSQIRAFHITNTAPLMVSQTALVPGSFPGASFIAMIENPSSSLHHVSEAFSVTTVSNSQSAIEVSTPANRWRNAVHPEDVNANGTVEPLDVLIIINFLNSRKENVLSTRDVVMPPYYDVVDDGRVTPLDVLVVINYLTRRHKQETAPEGESSSSWFMAFSPFDGEDVTHHALVGTSWVRENFDVESQGRFEGAVSQSVYRDVKQADFTKMLDRQMVRTVFRRNKLLNESEGLRIEWTDPSEHDAVFAELGLNAA